MATSIPSRGAKVSVKDRIKKIPKEMGKTYSKIWAGAQAGAEAVDKKLFPASYARDKAAYNLMQAKKLEDKRKADAAKRANLGY
jgi:hypothetical protein